ncbi:MAG: putative rRNA maturation factor [Candidatus Marinamargulisbacteria bacterium]|jgi:probable rRNA maturation factor
MTDEKDAEPQTEIQINVIESIETDFNLETFIRKILKLKNLTSGSFEFTLVNNTKIIEINKEFLNRDYATDIISFNLGEIDSPIGDIYISVEKAKENAETHNQTFDNELKLLIVHGILHLLDYKDYSDEEKKVMFKEQERLLNLVNE